MTDVAAPSVRQLLADLHAYRLQTMAKADLQVNIEQRQLLENTADRNAFVQAGDVVEPFSLPEVHGGTIKLGRLLADGPVVLLFFRYAATSRCATTRRSCTPRSPAWEPRWSRSARRSRASLSRSRTDSASASRWRRTPATSWPAASA
jgi:hypothetical protein